MLTGPSDTGSTSLVKQAAENRPAVPPTDVIDLDGEGVLDLGGEE